MSLTLPFKYRRLPGRGRRTEGPVAVTASRSSLWLGPDHLLSVDRLWMNEEYKRFYFRDIQAITVQQTNTASLWNWIYATLWVVSLVIVAAIDFGGPSAYRKAFIAMGIVSGFWLALILRNYLRGPSCICQLRTAVQTEVLPSLGRVSVARRSIAILKPLIAETQGVLPPEAVLAGAPAPAAAPALAPQPPPRREAKARRLESGAVHLALYGTLLLDAAAGFYAHANPQWHMYVLSGALLMLAVTTLSFLAMIRQRDTDAPEGLRLLTQFTFGWVLLMLLVVFVYGFTSRTMYTITHPGLFPSHINFRDMYGFKWVTLVGDIIETGLGATGLAMTLGHRAHRSRSAAETDQSGGGQ